MGSEFKMPRSNFTGTGLRLVNYTADQLLIEKLKFEWKEFVANTSPYPDIYKGKGIVMCAGGLKYFTCAWVAMNMLRRQGCILPVEIWYTGEELTLETIEVLETFNVKCKNAADYSSEEVESYCLKPFAILHSEFKEVLYLDADNNCMTDPAYLFDCEEFKTFGAVFWPDFWKTGRNNPIWQIVDSADYEAIEQESGQILINKERCWRELNLCLYFNLNKEYYYNMLLGDKDTFKFAWVALRSSFHMIHTPVGQCGYTDIATGFFHGFSMVQHDPSGNILFIHRNMLKWDITQEDERVWKQIKRFKSMSGLKFRAGTVMFEGNIPGITFFDLMGDTEVIDFTEYFGDFETKCLGFLRELRNSEFYARFMLHSYFVFCRPGFRSEPKKLLV